jgi:hypothetical protein
MNWYVGAEQGGARPEARLLLDMLMTTLVQES